LLLVALILAAPFCSVMVFLYPGPMIITYGMVAVSALTVLASMTLTVVFRRHKRQTWPIPLIGLGVMLAAFLAAMLLNLPTA
jgi:hypothetical protein